MQHQIFIITSAFTCGVELECLRCGCETIDSLLCIKCADELFDDSPLWFCPSMLIGDNVLTMLRKNANILLLIGPTANGNTILLDNMKVDEQVSKIVAGKKDYVKAARSLNKIMMHLGVPLEMDDEINMKFSNDDIEQLTSIIKKIEEFEEKEESENVGYIDTYIRIGNLFWIAGMNNIMDVAGKSWAENKKKYCFEKALKYYDKSLQMKERKAVKEKEIQAALKNKALLLQQLGRYEDSSPYIDQLLKTRPKDYLPWNCKGLIFYHSKEYENAVKCYDKALEIDGEKARVWKNKADALVKNDDLKAALKCYDTSLELKGDYIDALIAKGDVLAKLGDVEKAVQCYDGAEAIRMDMEKKKAKGKKRKKRG